MVLEEFPFPKDILKKQIQLTDQEALLNATGNSQAAIERQDSLPEHDFEMSPSSPTLLLRNIEKQVKYNKTQMSVKPNGWLQKQGGSMVMTAKKKDILQSWDWVVIN